MNTKIHRTIGQLAALALLSGLSITQPAHADPQTPGECSTEWVQQGGCTFESRGVPIAVWAEAFGQPIYSDPMPPPPDDTISEPPREYDPNQHQEPYRYGPANVHARIVGPDGQVLASCSGSDQQEGYATCNGKVATELVALSLVSLPAGIPLRCEVSGTLFGTVLCGAPAGAYATEVTRKFVVPAGLTVNDLHFEFCQATDVTDKGPWGDVGGNGTNNVDLSNPDENDGDAPDNDGTLEPGDEFKLEFGSSANKIRYKWWWWTKDGAMVGAKRGNGTCQPLPPGPLS